MKCFVGLGSNLGDRYRNLEGALRRLGEISASGHLRISPVYETSALLLQGSPESWDRPFLNLAVEIDWPDSPIELLAKLQNIEQAMGRLKHHQRWAPRIIDLDLLLFGDEKIVSDLLILPHPELLNRSFVLDPLKDLAPQGELKGECLVVKARENPGHSPLTMAIVNVTPDSFSDGDGKIDYEEIENRLRDLVEARVPYIDLGAESTRPGAAPINAQLEWQRLRPILEFLTDLLKGKILRPRITIDTRRGEVAEQVLKYSLDGKDLIDGINDVSGLNDPALLEVLASSHCDYVLMHSLSVPADPKICLSFNEDPVKAIKEWWALKLEKLEAWGIDPQRIILDPGIGFGKTPQQSATLLNRFEEFADLPFRLLVGHSRKSFMKTPFESSPRDRDSLTQRWSKQLASKGVDILRVHQAFNHHKTELTCRREDMQLQVTP